MKSAEDLLAEITDPLGFPGETEKFLALDYKHLCIKVL
jgi:hypothetical protein